MGFFDLFKDKKLSEEFLANVKLFFILLLIMPTANYFWQTFGADTYDITWNEIGMIICGLINLALNLYIWIYFFMLYGSYQRMRAEGGNNKFLFQISLMVLIVVMLCLWGFALDYSSMLAENILQ